MHLCLFAYARAVQIACTSRSAYVTVCTASYLGVSLMQQDGYVWWAASLVQQSAQGHGCDGVEVAAFKTSLPLELPATFGDLQPSLVNVAPLHGDIALLGEAGTFPLVATLHARKDASLDGRVSQCI